MVANSDAATASAVDGAGFGPTVQEKQNEHGTYPWIEGQEENHMGILSWVVVGVVGILGGTGTTGFNVWSILVATLGAVILLALYRVVAGRRSAS